MTFTPGDEVRVKTTLTPVTVLAVSPEFVLIRSKLGFQQAYRVEELEPLPAPVCEIPA
jgi:hypothetical protein